MKTFSSQFCSQLSTSGTKQDVIPKGWIIKAVNGSFLLYICSGCAIAKINFFWYVLCALSQWQRLHPNNCLPLTYFEQCAFFFLLKSLTGTLTQDRNLIPRYFTSQKLDIHLYIYIFTYINTYMHFCFIYVYLHPHKHIHTYENHICVFRKKVHNRCIIQVESNKFQ